MDFLRKWYPIPSTFLIGGVAIIQIPLMIRIVWRYEPDILSMVLMLMLTVGMLVGWVLTFVSPRDSRYSRELKFLGFDFPLIGILFMFTITWASLNTPPDEGLWINPFVIMDSIAIVAFPICNLLFWVSIIRDCIPRTARMKYYILAFHPEVAFGIILILAMIYNNAQMLYLIGPSLGLGCMAMGIILYKRRILAEIQNEFDIDAFREMDANQRELNERLDETGFKG